MKYRIEEVAGEEDGDRVFLRVSFWYGNKSTKSPADCEGEFLIHAGPEVVTRPIFNELGTLCLTESGDWLPPWKEVNGEWQRDFIGPEHDPFQREVVDDEYPFMRKIIEDVGRGYEAEGRRSRDGFNPGEVRKDVGRAQGEVRKDVGRAQGIKAALEARVRDVGV